MAAALPSDSHSPVMTITERLVLENPESQPGLILSQEVSYMWFYFYKS